MTAPARPPAPPDVLPATVLRAEHLTPNLRRVTLGGEALRDFPLGRHPADAVGVLVAPLADPDGKGRPAPVARAYTVRRFNPALPELDVDVYLHGDTPGSAWARDVRPGDATGLWRWRPEPRPAPDADAWVLAGDETALPALASFVEAAPPGLPLIVRAELGDPRDAAYLPWREGADVRVVLRLGAAPGARLHEALRALPWPPGRVSAWIAAEASAARAMRASLRADRRLPDDLLHAAGYWRA